MEIDEPVPHATDAAVCSNGYGNSEIAGTYQATKAMPLNAENGMETGFLADRPYFSNIDPGLNDLGADWMHDPLDMAWLTSAPFEMDFEMMTAGVEGAIRG